MSRSGKGYFLGPCPGDYPLGSLESRAAARAVLSAQELEAQEQNDALYRNMTPLGQALMELFSGPTGQPSPGAAMLCKAIEEKHKLFGMPLPESLRHQLRVMEEVAKIKQERAASGEATFLDEKELREMGKDRLRREGRDTG